ncbi:MAG TPA: hypothetical protein PKJ24_06395 [Prolixibacteraceae bacterium]|nr:hypothetical protein [Prolixibacteraceae bacterium]
MRKAAISVVTEDGQDAGKARELAVAMVDVLGLDWQIVRIEKYHKFEDAFKIELECILQEDDICKINQWSVSGSDKIASPWLLYFDDDEQSIELIFNRNEHSRERKAEFRLIRWVHWQIIR